MPVKDLIKHDTYQDSVFLMRLAQEISQMEGVQVASALMATPQNKEVLKNTSLLTPDAERAGPNDLVIVVAATSATIAEEALRRAEERLVTIQVPARETGMATVLPRNLDGALRRWPQANLVSISTPGPYAAAEALKALKRGLHVFLFSDNVSLEDELMLKRRAQESDLLVMGPDCGTAIIRGVPLGFANAVRRGTIGLVAASGSGLQEVTSLIHNWGGGVSQAIGTGSRDLHGEIGGISMRMGIDALQEDDDTKVLVLLSKPPEPRVASAILDHIATACIPVVVCFLGGDPADIQARDALAATTLEEAAWLAVCLSQGWDMTSPLPSEDLSDTAAAQRRGFSPEQRYISGLFSGGTLCYEAMLILQRVGRIPYSNVPLRPEWAWSPSRPVASDLILDLGSDEFTVGRPHPMIDFRTRLAYLKGAGQDPQVRVILLDVILGYGAHPDPAGELAPAIADAKDRAGAEGRSLAIVASICGTDDDPQGFLAQKEKLQRAGAVIAPTSAQAARLAVAIAVDDGAGGV